MLTNSSAKRVLCFGDSNTFGVRADNWERFTVQERWTALLQKQLGTEVDIIEEGLGGRTTNLENPSRPGRNGRAYLTPCLLSHNPLDIVVIMLGTNDCKTKFKRTAKDIAEALGELVEDVRRHSVNSGGQPPQIILVSPVALSDIAAKDPHFNEVSIQTAKALKNTILAYAKSNGCYFFDANSVAEVGEDGIHLTLQAHAQLAKALAGIIEELV